MFAIPSKRPTTRAGKYLAKYAQCQGSCHHSDHLMLALRDDEQEVLLVCFYCFQWSHWRLAVKDSLGSQVCLAKGKLTTTWRYRRGLNKPWGALDDEMADRAAIYRLR